MNSNNTTKRFIVGRKRTPTNLPINLEATKELREKLERFAEKKKEAVQALDKVVLEKKILENWESEQVDVEDIRELVNQANFLELDCSREALDKARDNLRKTETLLGINLRKSNARVREVLEEGEVMKVWEIELQVDEEENPDVVVKQWIVTKDIPGSAQLPSLHSVRLVVEGLGDDLDDDFRAAIAFCEEEKEPQRFTHLVVNYLPLVKEREDLLQIPFMPHRAGDRKHVSLLPGGKMVFKNSLSQTLFVLNIRVKMQLQQPSGWSLKWKVEVTEEGAEACEAMNLPRSLLRSGHVDGWGTAEAIDTLLKAARFDAQTPRKELVADSSQRTMNLLSPRTETPRGEPDKRAKQRKLNMN